MDDRRCYDILQTRRVFVCRSIYSVQLIVGERLKLYLKNRSLYRIKPGIHSDANVIVLEGTFAVHAIGFDKGGPLVIIREYSPSVSVASHGFGGEEGCGGDVAEAAGSFDVYAAAEALGSVFKYQKPVTVGNLPDMRVIGRESEEVDGYDYFRSKLSFCQDLLYGALKICGVEIESVFADVDKDRSCPLK